MTLEWCVIGVVEEWRSEFQQAFPFYSLVMNSSTLPLKTLTELVLQYNNTAFFVVAKTIQSYCNMIEINCLF